MIATKRLRLLVIAMLAYAHVAMSPCLLAGEQIGSNPDEVPVNGGSALTYALTCDLPDGCTMRMAKIEVDFITEATFRIRHEFGYATYFECRITDSQYGIQWLDWASGWRWTWPYDGLGSAMVHPNHPIEIAVDTAGWCAVCENAAHEPDPEFSWFIGAHDVIMIEWQSLGGTACEWWDGNDYVPHDDWSVSPDPLLAVALVSWHYVWTDPRARGDLTGDGVVDVCDLLFCLGLWYDGDPLTGCFTADDLFDVLNNWTP